MIIYNIFPTLAGKFKDWMPHIERAASMGFDWIFVNPVQYPGFSGSLYSIKDYHTLNPALTDEESPLSPDEQLSEVIKQAGNMGLKVMVDLVINHSAIDSPIVTEHPEWYQRDSEGKAMNPFAMDGEDKVVWGDLAKFDHEGSSDKEGMYKYFHLIVEHLTDLGFKGFRCDAAYQIPVEFWRRLISQTKAGHPDIVFTAETLGCSPEETLKTGRAGFDYIFNSSKWWDFKSPWLMEQYNMTSPELASISFPESHDTPRLADEFRSSKALIRRNYMFSAFFSSGVMITQGFEHGFTKRLDVVKTRPSDMEGISTDLTDYIAQINKIKKSSAILNIDAPMKITNHTLNTSILLMSKSHPDLGTALVAINMDASNAQRFSADINPLSGVDGNLCFNVIGDDTIPSSKGDITDGLDIMLRPGTGAVFTSCTKKV